MTQKTLLVVSRLLYNHVETPGSWMRSMRAKEVFRGQPNRDMKVKFTEQHQTE